MDDEARALKIIKDLAGNAANMKKCSKEGNLPESIRLTGERVALVEDLRALKDSKVSLANSDKKYEMSILVKNIEDDVKEAIGTINARLSSLSNELVKVRDAKKIAAYRVQGGRYGY